MHVTQMDVDVCHLFLLLSLVAKFRRVRYLCYSAVIAAVAHNNVKMHRPMSLQLPDLYEQPCMKKFRTTKGSVRITKMLMWAGSRAKRAKRFFCGPSWWAAPPGGPEKLQADCLVVTNSAKCFMLFIVNSAKSFVKPVVTTVIYLVYN